MSEDSRRESFQDLHELVRSLERQEVPLVGVTGIVGAGVLAALAPEARVLAAIALAAQLVWLALYSTIAKPINARMIAALGTSASPDDARALQARWDSILIPRATLLALALCSLLLALTKLGR